MAGGRDTQQSQRSVERIRAIGVLSNPCRPLNRFRAGRLIELNRSGFDAASFCEKDAVHVEALPGRAA